VEKIELLKSVNDIGALYHMRVLTRETASRQDAFAGVLDLMAVLNARDSFLACAMAFCNELTSRFACGRTSLGWLHNGYVRLQAMSHSDQFDKKMDAVQKLEAAMEEALDQDAEILFPAPASARTISKDHAGFARMQDAGWLLSLPLRVDGHAVAVCSLERTAGPFTESDQRLLRLACDQAARRLDDLKRNDRWLGALIAARFRNSLEPLLGFEHTWAKISAVTATVILALLCFVPVEYRLEAPVILRTDDVAYLTAPFDGHIDKVNVRLGDQVKEGDELLQLDRNSLLMEEAGLVAEMNRYQREGEKARASDALADMRIAEAQHDQASARLDAVHFKLSQSSATAPFAGVIVEGELRERLGSPVKQGDMLFKVARTDRIYAELEVRESEIQNVHPEMRGEVTLASRPYDTFKTQVFRIIPSAVVKKDGNAFLVHCGFQEGSPDWWRPGMTGLAKLNAGKYSLLWIFTHRTVDFLRLKLWW
jgi:multidrug resistance efflux pump